MFIVQGKIVLIFSVRVIDIIIIVDMNSGTYTNN